MLRWPAMNTEGGSMAWPHGNFAVCILYSQHSASARHSGVAALPSSTDLQDDSRKCSVTGQRLCQYDTCPCRYLHHGRHTAGQHACMNVGVTDLVSRGWPYFVTNARVTVMPRKGPVIPPQELASEPGWSETITGCELMCIVLSSM